MKKLSQKFKYINKRILSLLLSLYAIQACQLSNGKLELGSKIPYRLLSEENQDSNIPHGSKDEFAEKLSEDSNIPCDAKNEFEEKLLVYGKTLIEFIKKNDVNQFKKYYKTLPEPIQKDIINYRVEPEEGNTLIMVAAKYDRGKICKYLIKKGCDTNLRNKENYTPIMIAYCIFYSQHKLSFSSAWEVFLSKKCFITESDASKIGISSFICAEINCNYTSTKKLFKDQIISDGFKSITYKDWQIIGKSGLGFPQYIILSAIKKHHRHFDIHDINPILCILHKEGNHNMAKRLSKLFYKKEHT